MIHPAIFLLAVIALAMTMGWGLYLYNIGLTYPAQFFIGVAFIPAGIVVYQLYQGMREVWNEDKGK